jgi:hypothetical protein
MDNALQSAGLEAGPSADISAKPSADLSAEQSFWLITDISLPKGLESAGPLPIGSKTAKMAAGELLDEAALVAKPRAAFRLAVINRSPNAPDDLNIGGVRFKSPLLSNNLRELGRAFPFLATEGPELARWAEGLPLKKRTAAFLIRYAALKEAERRVEERLMEVFGIKSLGAMSPGVLPQWPLTAQKSLFELLSPLPAVIGVSLSGQSMWMSPDMSSSGLFFETEVDYHNCRLCPLDKCPMRRYERSA